VKGNNFLVPYYNSAVLLGSNDEVCPKTVGRGNEFCNC
jgi:hypothetical protein